MEKQTTYFTSFHLPCGLLFKSYGQECNLSRCSKIFFIILSKYFYFALRSCTAFVCPALSHIARYAPSHRTNNYGTITQFKCKNNFEHLLKKLAIHYRTEKTTVVTQFSCLDVCVSAESSTYDNGSSFQKK